MIDPEKAKFCLACGELWGGEGKAPYTCTPYPEHDFIPLLVLLERVRELEAMKS